MNYRHYWATSGAWKFLQLSDNTLTGEIPPELANLERLWYLDLQHNDLSGTIPPELGKLGSIFYLYLNDNDLTGQIPPELGNLRVFGLSLSNNRLSGDLPRDLGNISADNTTQLIRLDLRNNDLTGNAVPGLENKILFLQGNRIASSSDNRDKAVLTALYEAAGGETWNYQRNWLSTEPLVEWEGVSVGPNGRVTALELGENYLTGELPPELGDLTSLRILQLGSQWGGQAGHMEGAIPPELGDLGNLTWLNLSGLQLAGRIPPELGKLNNLSRLHLNNNQLSGTIPPELGNLESLTALYLYDNQLTGEIPAELANLEKLWELELNQNILTGEWPSAMGNLPRLWYLDLEGNNLTGCVSAKLQRQLLRYSLAGLPFCAE